MRPDLDPVWILFRRRTFSRLAYWCMALGYNFNDRSPTNRFYFVYFCAFWLAWIVVVLAMFGSALASFFKSMQEAPSPPALVVLFGALLLVLWGLAQIWLVTGRSPFVFGESDAFLLCQTPVSRRSVGLAWFLMDWLGTVLPFAAGACIFSFALVETALPQVTGLGDLLAYFVATLRALTIILPLQMGLQAGIWGVGALRLRRYGSPRQLPWLRPLALLLGSGLLAMIFLYEWSAVVFTPLTFLLQAAFYSELSLSAWLLRAAFGSLVLLAGMLSLSVGAGQMHLGQAAQETRMQSNIRLAHDAMNYQLAEIISRQARLKAAHPPSWVPTRSGVWMLVWKDIILLWRSLDASHVLRWFWVFILSLGVFLAPDWGVQLIFGGLWAVSLGELATKPLRRDLAHWWLLRSLPLQNSKLLFAQLGPACGLGLMLGWLALALVGLPPPFDWLAAVLLPFLVANAALGSARDILNRADVQTLMAPGLAEENVPSQDIHGVLIILLSIGLPLGLLAWGNFHLIGLVWALLSLPIAILLTFLNFKSALSAYRWLV